MTNEKQFLTAVLAAFLLSWIPFSAAYGQSNYLPSPFPLCSMDGGKDKMHIKIDGLYSNVNADSSDFDFSGFSVLFVKENPDVGKPSFHVGLFGELVEGEQDEDIDIADVKGYSGGASVTPSFVLTDRFHSFRPSVFVGANVLYQNLDEFSYSDNIHFLFRWGADPITVPKEKEMIQMGFYTGIYLEFNIGKASVSPFLMTQAVKGRYTEKYYTNDVSAGDEKKAISLAVHTAGIEFRLGDPGISILAMAHIVLEEKEEDAEAYTVMAGIAF